jgi:sugar O-acyltransferase (sialic acid O-acetyltransferase NeuD family)
MMQRLLILGAGGSALDVLDIVEAINALRPTWDPIGILDDSRSLGSRHLGLEILGQLRDAPKFAGCVFVNTIGSDKSYRDRPEILASTGVSRDRFATLVHPSASVSSRACLGLGVVVNPAVVIGGAVFIGDHVTICPGCILGHESSIGPYSILAPGAVISGLVEVEPSCYIGAAAVIRQKLRIGKGSLIGMGAAVIRDVGSGECVVGNPARSIGRCETYGSPRVEH